MFEHEKKSSLDVTLKELDKTKITAAGLSNSNESERRKSSLKTVMGATSLLLLGALQTYEAVAQDSEPTETPTPQATLDQAEIARRILERQAVMSEIMNAPIEELAQVPTETPTPGETRVASAHLDSNRFVRATELESYPQTIQYINPLSQQEVRVNIDPSRLSQLMTINGTPLALGVYDEQNPIPIDPEVFEDYQEWSSGDLRPAYIVGVLTEVNGAQDQNAQNFYVNPEIVVSIPLPNGRDFFPVNIFMTTVGGRFGAIDETGRLIPFPSHLLDANGRIPYQSNGVNHITYSNDENWIAFPTSQGTSTVRVGDPIVVRVVFNLDVYSEGYRRSFIVGSSGRLPEEVVADLYDSEPNNNGEWYQESSAFATIFTPQ